jgi:hypothetical protein
MCYCTVTVAQFNHLSFFLVYKISTQLNHLSLFVPNFRVNKISAQNVSFRFFNNDKCDTGAISQILK